MTLAKSDIAGLGPLLLCRHPLIAMVQSAQNRRVAIESLVRPGRMVVCLDEFPQQSLQVALAQDGHMVQKLSA